MEATVASHPVKTVAGVGGTAPRPATQPVTLAPKEPPLGSHVVTPRCGYLHHGIFVGEGKVVHYAGFVYGLRRGPVEETSLSKFADGHPIWIKSNARSAFDQREVVRRARSRIGEDRYRLFTNNCEHLCEWSVRGQHRSYQVESWLPVRVIRRYWATQFFDVFARKSLL
jgi:hypothetical protein